MRKRALELYTELKMYL